MTTTITSLAATSSTLANDGKSASQRVVAVHSCSRLGRKANPPSRSFANWFWSRRRR
jgi:hypothetical protein